MHHQELEKIRDAVGRWFRQRLPEFDPRTLGESVLLRGSRVVGHQFVHRGTKIHWYVGQPKLLVFEDGQAPVAVELTEPAPTQKAA